MVEPSSLRSRYQSLLRRSRFSRTSYRNRLIDGRVTAAGGNSPSGAIKLMDTCSSSTGGSSCLRSCSSVLSKSSNMNACPPSVVVEIVVEVRGGIYSVYKLVFGRVVYGLFVENVFQAPLLRASRNIALLLECQIRLGRFFQTGNVLTGCTVHNPALVGTHTEVFIEGRVCS